MRQFQPAELMCDDRPSYPEQRASGTNAGRILTLVHPLSTRPMNYQYELFISYRRAYDWHEWVQDVFFPLLKRRLDRGDKAIFLDTQAESLGLPWPPKLAMGMARSKVLLVLWTRQYYEASHWCKIELDFFLERERRLGLQNPGLIVPVVINNCASLHQDLKLRSPLDLSDYSGTYTKLSKHYEELERLVHKVIVPAISEKIDVAPAFDPAWDDVALDETQRAIEATRGPVQDTLPSLAADPRAT